jgi:hypothetical protein
MVLGTERQMNTFPRIRNLWVAGMVLAGIAGMALLMIPQRWCWSDRYCLDNGDIRRCFCAIPISREEIPEVQRNILIAACERANIPHIWVSSNWANRYQQLYEDASTWEAVDPKILTLILEDVSTQAKQGRSPAYAESRDIVPFGKAAIDQHGGDIDWKTNPEVIRFCLRYGYIP